ncbi:hypothetical protein JQ629_35635 [Bradyrhizobium sp. AUGA SZCCT0222]|uniref:hypothetical protein n=1 Tax=Bradyrhizobium sp. AUGA SZCCT0222 TaxID=2807668 RepID=UPI001BA80DB0|nr:hypothetical protein [Bradyrhizobium sp. AUGA SZCCT0222]MBR1272819.1 hypothetical protein [Bradyrhizobium sp. AUGA SZCCT0222]
MLSSNRRYVLVTIRDVQAELGVTYRTAALVWTRICAGLRTYSGHNKGFGTTVTAFISSTRPTSKAGRLNWYLKSKKRLNGEDGVPKVTGLLSAFARAEAPAENLERTERLLRVLIAATPKPSKSAKRKAAKLRRLERATLNSGTLGPPE